MSHPQSNSTPKHLWIVGVLSLLWNAMGAMDYVMTKTKNEAYMGEFTEAQLEFFYGLPTWYVALWAIAVWGAVLGSVLILLRRSLAAPVLLISFSCMLVNSIHSYAFSNGLEVMGDGVSLTFTGVIFVISLLLVIYSRNMRSKGVLA